MLIVDKPRKAAGCGTRHVSLNGKPHELAKSHSARSCTVKDVVVDEVSLNVCSLGRETSDL
jgi:hypothetical protein